MSNTTEFLSILFYVVLIVLGITLIILTINTIKTLKKVDVLIDDISDKSRKLDSLFNVIDNATGAVVSFSDSLVGILSKPLGKILKRKKEKNNE